MIYFEIFDSIIECIIIVHFCNRFLEFKNAKYGIPASIGFFIVLALDNVFLSQRKGFENISVIIMLLSIFCYLMLFMNGSIFEKALVSLSPTIVMMPIALLTANIIPLVMDTFDNINAERIAGIVISRFLYFLVYEVIIKFKKGQKYSLSSYQWLIMLFCFGISFSIATVLWNYTRLQDDTLFEVVIIYILLISLNLLLYLLLNKMQRDSVISAEYNELSLALNHQKQTAIELSKKYEEIQTLRHDMKHYLMTSVELINEDKSIEATKYLENILEEKIRPFSVKIQTGSAIIDATIGTKQAFCETNNIKFKILIDNQFGNISELDLSVLLSNMIDNAINGCQNVDDAEIELRIERSKSYLIIIVTNTIKDSVLTSNPHLRSTKGEHHGYGVKSMRNIAESYGGSLNFYEKGDIFYTEIMLKTG